MWTSQLPPDLADRVLALAARAAAADGGAALNEEARLALRDAHAAHRWFTRADLPAGDRAASGPDRAVLGYLQWQPAYRTAQLVVDPAYRRRGLGRRLLAELAGRVPAAAGDDWGVWAFHDLPAAQGLATAAGLRPTRTLLVMERTLAGVEAPRVPPGLSLRGFEPADAEAVLAVNAAAFAHHPEQGTLDAAGLAARMAEPWFDPAGLILGFDADGLAGFHWTKRTGDLGEVYVIGVTPHAQGHGYGRVLLQAGLAHLAGTGADRVELYVDTAEPVAVRMYEGAGFHLAHRDVLYAPDHQEQP